MDCLTEPIADRRGRIESLEGTDVRLYDEWVCRVEGCCTRALKDRGQAEDERREEHPCGRWESLDGTPETISPCRGWEGLSSLCLV